MQTALAQDAQTSIHIDRCKSCRQPVDRDYLNGYSACFDCAVRDFADYIEEHPHATRADIMAEGRCHGLNDARINLIMSIHRMNWGGR